MDDQREDQWHEGDTPYVALLVRCWREGEQLRFLLENVATRERRGFETLEAFLEALEIILAESTHSA